MLGSLHSAPGVARRGLVLDVLTMQEPLSASPSPFCQQVDQAVSPAFLNQHRLSVHSALSQADTPTYARSPDGSVPDDLSQDDTRDCYSFPSNRDAMCIDDESHGIYVLEEPERKKRSTRRRRSSLLEDAPFSPRPKSEDFNQVGEAVARMSVEPLAPTRCHSWCAGASLDLEIQDVKKLKTLTSVGSVGELEVETVAEILRQDPKVRDLFDHVFVIDCRYPYEFEGGHISEAATGDWVSVHNFAPHQVEEAREFLFGSHRQLELGNDRVCVIFHCEFSQKRGPAMCEKMRSHDRSCNFETYPALYYPEMYVMKGGYKTFYEAGNASLCAPHCYVPEKDKRFAEECKYFHKLGKPSSGRKGRQFLAPDPTHISPLR